MENYYGVKYNNKGDSNDGISIGFWTNFSSFGKAGD